MRSHIECSAATHLDDHLSHPIDPSGSENGSGAPRRVGIRCSGPVVLRGLVSIIAGEPALKLASTPEWADLILWVIDDYVGEPIPPPTDGKPIVLFNRRGDFEDEELRRAGIAAYVGPGSGPPQIVRGIEAAMRGEWLALRGQLPETWRRLTPRLRTIARCLMAGETEATIARHLFITRETVHDHVRRLYQQIGIHRRCDLFVYLRDS